MSQIFVINRDWPLDSETALISETSHPHYASKLVAYKNKPLAVGHFDWSSGNNKVEAFDFSAKTWSEMEAYPFHSE